tara:strand:- start:22 stop:1362 length:1341 start_codon:yes stop_codon:yes gene_type:complete
MNLVPGHRLKFIRAFTMVELMGAVTIALVLIMMLYSIFNRVQNVFVTGQNKAIAMDEARSAMDIMVENFQMLNRAGDENGNWKNLSWMPVVTTYDSTYPLAPAPPAYINNALISAPFKVTVETSGNRVGLDATLRVEESGFVDYSDPPHSSAPIPSDSQLKLYHHNCRFFSFDGAWRLVHYQFGPRDKYFMPLSKIPDDPSPSPSGVWSGLLDSPVGALWVYRSPPALKGGFDGGLHQQVVDHLAFQKMEIPPRWNSGSTYDEGMMVLDWVDKSYYQYTNEKPYQTSAPWLDTNGANGKYWAKMNTGGLDPPLGFARLVDGVIHFRVRAADPNNPERDLREYTDENNPFTGYHLPTHIVVELAVLDRKLLKEVESGMEQQLEGLELSAAEEAFISGAYSAADQPYQHKIRLAAERCQLRLKKINENLDRVYFFKQLVRVRNLGGGQ